MKNKVNSTLETRLIPCWCACHRTGPKSPSCRDCGEKHAADKAMSTIAGHLRRLGADDEHADRSARELVDMVLAANRDSLTDGQRSE